MLAEAEAEPLRGPLPLAVQVAAEPEALARQALLVRQILVAEEAVLGLMVPAWGQMAVLAVQASSS